MKAKPCIFEQWRNYVPYAPDVEIEVSNSVPSEVDLGKLGLLLQGSGTQDGHSPTPDVLDKVRAQRGWRCFFQIVSPPQMGTATMNSSQDVITYSPRSGLIGTDCLNYVLSNGTQVSSQGRMFFKLSKQYLWKFIVTRLNPQMTLNKFATRPDFAPEMKPALYTEIFWYYNRPVVEVDDRGVKRVFTRSTRVASTRAKYIDFIEGRITKPEIVDQADVVDINTYFDTTLGPAFDGWSDMPYSPKNIQGDIETRFVIYTEQIQNQFTGLLQVDLSRPKTFTYLMSDLLGNRWWESGNIQ